MLYESLLDKIGFTEAMKLEYLKYQDRIGDKIECYSETYMHTDMPILEALSDVRKFESKDLPRDTIDLMFLLNSTGFLAEEYNKRGIAEERFFNSMKDIKYKVEECRKLKGIFGTFVAEWFDGFFRLNRMAFGRLQFDFTAHAGADVTVGDYVVHEGDFMLGCHIPSAGPLFHELCIESYKMAYDFVKKNLKDGILPIKCQSWLLYPPYQAVFQKGSNTHAFVQDFDVYQSDTHETFSDAWRVFNMDYTGDWEALPQKTTMQKRFVDYIKDGGTFGEGIGILLFDGDKIISAK